MAGGTVGKAEGRGGLREGVGRPLELGLSPHAGRPVRVLLAEHRPGKARRRGNTKPGHDLATFGSAASSLGGVRG